MTNVCLTRLPFTAAFVDATLRRRNRTKNHFATLTLDRRLFEQNAVCNHGTHGMTRKKYFLSVSFRFFRG